MINPSKYEPYRKNKPPLFDSVGSLKLLSQVSRARRLQKQKRCIWHSLATYHNKEPDLQ